MFWQVGQDKEINGLAVGFDSRATLEHHHVKVVTGQAQVAERKGKQAGIEAGKTDDSEHAETTAYVAIPRTITPLSAITYRRPPWHLRT